MKIDLEIVDQKGNINDLDTIECTFDPTGTSHLMSILSNIYSNAPLAVLREYSSNAYDSHVEAGNTAPIEVTLPTYLQPTLLIQDYGVGLSEKEVLDVYSRYGASTKRETNTQVGSFGIGSKAAFTIGQQFIVTGVKDGKKVVALFALNKAGVGTVNIVERSDTTEPNGVLISIGLENPSLINAEAESFFKTWKPGTVLVNGQQPKSILDKSYKVADDLHILNNEAYRGIWISMGTTAYPVSNSIIERLTNKSKSRHFHDYINQARRVNYSYSYAKAAQPGIYIQAGIGDVDITPSREGLRDTKKTLAYISEAVSRFADTLEEEIEKDLQSQLTYTDAAKYISTLNAKISSFDVYTDQLKWKDKPFPKIEIDLPCAFREHEKLRKYNNFGTKLPQSIQWDSTLVITDIPTDASKYTFNKLRRYMEYHEVDCVLFSDRKSDTIEWFSYGNGGPIETISYLTYKEEVLLLPKLGAARAETTYMVRHKDTAGSYNHMVAKDILALGKPIFYFHRNFPSSRFLNKLIENDNIAVVYYSQQRESGLLKRMPDAKPGYPEIKRLAQEFIDNLTDEEKSIISRAHQYVDDTGNTTAARSITGLKSKLILEHIRQVDNTIKLKQENMEVLHLFDAAQALVGSQDISKTKVITWDDVGERYPLLETILSYSWAWSEDKLYKKHINIYIDAVDKMVEEVEESPEGEIEGVQYEV